jgi:DNA ligase-1
MRRFALLCEELESRPEEGDRVAALARYLREVGREAGTVASEWVLHLADGRHARRPPRVPLPALAAAAEEVAAAAGTPPWLFAAGCAAEPETAEAIALLLPWPEVAWRPAFADWLAAWRDALARAAPDGRARALAWTIARLDDARARRWAVRAAAGLARPLVEEGAWLRAWSAAFGEDPHALAWRWHALGRRRAMATATPPADEATPRPRPFAAPVEIGPPAAVHAALRAALAAGEAWLEPRWAGLRVQVVRQAADVAVWRDDGVLLNALLPAALLAPEPWPDPCAIEGVLIGWQAGRVVSPWLAAAATPPARARRAAAGQRSVAASAESIGQAEAPPLEPPAPGATLHLVLTDWHRWHADEAAGWTAHERRERLHLHWPAHVPGAVVPPPAVFTTPILPRPATADDEAAAAAAEPAFFESLVAAVATLAPAPGHEAWSGLLVRRRVARGPHARDAAWSLRPAPRRVRAVLQYVPAEALGATAAAALAFVSCGFAVWNRAPRTPHERDAAMAAAMQGEVAVVDQDAGSDDALRLLPLARLPIDLPAPELRAIHAWLREHAGQRFGGVHAIAPALVFEIAFARLRPSRRHRLGAVPEEARVLRWLPEAPPGAADRAAELFAAAGRAAFGG